MKEVNNFSTLLVGNQTVETHANQYKELRVPSASKTTANQRNTCANHCTPMQTNAERAGGTNENTRPTQVYLNPLTQGNYSSQPKPANHHLFHYMSVGQTGIVVSKTLLQGADIVYPPGQEQSENIDCSTC